MVPSNPSLFFDLHVFFLFSLPGLGFIFLYLLFIYVFSNLSMCLLSVNLVKSKLDPESLGIILLGPFLLEFFPDQVGVNYVQTEVDFDFGGAYKIWQILKSMNTEHVHIQNSMGAINVYFPNICRVLF